MNADGWHKVCEYLPHLQAIRISEKRMSTVEVVAPPQMLEQSVDATVLPVETVDTGVQAVVETTECSIQFSPTMIDQEISAVPAVNEVAIDARPSFAEAGVLAIPTLLEKSIGATVVEMAVGSLTNVASKSLEAIVETVAPKETPNAQTESPPKVSLPIRMMRAYMYIFMFPIRLLLCSAEPMEKEKAPVEETPPSNATSEKSPVTPTPTGEKTTNDVESSDKAVGSEPEPTVHISRAVPVTAF